jgi:hypothetical protein
MERTPPGRGKVSDNRYILLAGMDQEGTGSTSSTPRRQLEIEGEDRTSAQVQRTGGGQGGKRTLDERSPGMHDQTEKVVRQRTEEFGGHGGQDDRDG